MKTHAQNSMKTLSKAVWTNLKTGLVILSKEICWMAGGLSHKMEVRQLQKQASQEEAAYGRRLLEALQEASKHNEGSDAPTPTIPTPKDAEAIRERILFIREEIVRLEKLRRDSRTRHEAKIRTRFQQDEKEAEAAEPVVLDIPDIPYTPEPEDIALIKDDASQSPEATAQSAPEATPSAKPDSEAAPAAKN